jgi:hypothetical protein
MIMKNKTTFFVYKNRIVVATFQLDDEVTEEEILGHFQAAHLLYGDDIKFKIKK